MKDMEKIDKSIEDLQEETKRKCSDCSRFINNTELVEDNIEAFKNEIAKQLELTLIKLFNSKRNRD